MSLQDLIPFLESPKVEVSKAALESVLPYTPSSAGKVAEFRKNDFQGCRVLKKLCTQSEDHWIILNALIALINISDDREIRQELVRDSKAVAKIAKLAAASPKESYTKYACMLLSNLAHEEDVVVALEGPIISALVLNTAKPQYVEDVTYDYLTFVFAEFARRRPRSIAKLLPYLYTQLSAGSDIRRKGVAAAIKNTLFEADLHQPLSEDTPLIEVIMIRLKGPEIMDKADFLQLPPAVRKEADELKEREPLVEIQTLLMECLLLLSSSQVGRDALRTKKAYFVVRELHKSTQDSTLLIICEKFVNMVMRGDPVEQSPKIEELRDDTDNDSGVTEVL